MGIVNWTFVMNRRNTVITIFLSFFAYVIFTFLTRPNSSFYKKPVRIFTEDQDQDAISFAEELEIEHKQKIEKIEEESIVVIPTPPERNPERLKHPFNIDEGA